MESLDDPMWYRIAALRPRLRLRVRVQRRVVRGAVWYVLIDDERRRFHRVDAVAYQIVGRLDGQLTIDAVWRGVHTRLGDAAPTQGETLRMLSQLSDAELLTIHADSDAGALLKRRQERQRNLRAAVANPLSFKVPLFNPSRWLEAGLPLARWLFGGWGLLAWLLLTGAGAVLALRHLDPLQHALSSQLRSAGFLFQMWALYPLVKLVHEACHALAVRRWGGEVHEVGVNLVVFSPLPYVDASAANGFAQKHRRMTVSAAGVMAELAVASVAVLVWLASASPLVQTLSLAVMASCGLSTLLFNANPLARFDGYYLLCDALDLPNLQQRGRAMVGYLMQRLAGIAPARSGPEATRREAVGVAVYAVLAWLYQAAVVVGMAYWLLEPYPWLAAAVLMFGVWMMLVRPLGRMLTGLLSDGRYNGRRLRLVGVTGGGAGLTLVLLCLVPAPSFTVQQGVVWTPPEATVRAEAPGELVALLVASDQPVQAGQPIARLDNLPLRSEREATHTQWQQLDIQYFNALLSDPLEAQRVALARDAMQGRLQHLDQQLGQMTVRAGQAGQLIVPKETGQPGHVYQRGEELGYILSARNEMVVKLALSEAEAALMRDRAARVTVRLAARPGHALHATLARETPSATRTLPSAVLGSAAGGPIATDPDDSAGRQTLASVVVVDVRVPGHRTNLIGAKAWVRIDHRSEPLATQWARVIRQAFLARLGAG